MRYGNTKQHLISNNKPTIDYIIMNRLTIILTALCFAGMTAVAQKTAQVKQLLTDEKYTEAIELSTSELRSYPKNGELYRCRAIAYLYLDQYGQALQDITALLSYAKSADLTVSEVYQWLGNVYKAIGDNEKALADFNTAIKKDKHSASAYANRASLYYSLNEYTSALKDYQTAAKLAPTEEDYPIGQARCLFMLNRTQEAQQLLSTTLSLYPNNAEGWRLSAVIAYLIGDGETCIDRSIRYFNLYYAQNDDFPNADMLLWTAKDFYPYLLQAVTKQIDSSTGEEKLFYQGLRIRVYMTKEYYADAIKELNTMEANLQASGPNPFVLSNRAECYQALYQYRKAVADYNALLAVTDNYWNGYLQRGLCYAGLGKYDEAIADFSTVIQNDIQLAYYAYYRRGWVYEFKKDTAAALSDYSRGIELQDDYAYLHLKRGKVYKAMGDTLLAKADFEKVLAVDTVADNGSCRQYALFFLGQNEQAIAWQQQMIENAPTDAGNQYDAACLYARMGKTEDALNAFERCLNLGYRDFQHIEADDDLDAIRKEPRFEQLLNRYRQSTVQNLLDSL